MPVRFKLRSETIPSLTMHFVAAARLYTPDRRDSHEATMDFGLAVDAVIERAVDLLPALATPLRDSFIERARKFGGLSAGYDFTPTPAFTAMYGDIFAELPDATPRFVTARTALAREGSWMVANRVDFAKAALEGLQMVWVDTRALRDTLPALSRARFILLEARELLQEEPNAWLLPEAGLMPVAREAWSLMANELSWLSLAEVCCLSPKPATYEPTAELAREPEPAEHPDFDRNIALRA